MFDHVVESLIVRLDPEILLNVVGFFVQLVLIKAIQDFVRLFSFLVESAVDLGHGCLLVTRLIQSRLKVIGFGGRTAKHFALCPKIVRCSSHFDRGLVRPFKDL